MALTPGLYVPQGQVGTGAAYVHEIKDRSNYIEALAEAAKEQRVHQEKQLAKIKGFDYGKVVDPVMKKHISEQYKKGLTAFSEIVSKGGNISNITTPEGIAYSDWENNIKNEADTAARAEAMKSQFQTTVANNVDDYDVDIVNAALSSYDNAETPDQKLKAMVNFNPLYVRGFDYNKWINTQFDNAVKDVELTDFGGDVNKYQEVYNKKIDVLPDVLAVDPGYPIAELQWQRKKDKGEAGFQQENFGQFLTEQIDYQNTLRQSKRQSPAAKPDITNVYNNTGTPTAGTTTEGSTANVGGLINSPNIGEDFNTGKAFFATDDNGVETLVLKYNTGNYKDIGLNDKTGAYTDPQDANAVVIPAKNLWTVKDSNFTTVNLQPESGKASEFKAATFYDEGGKSYTGVPTRVYKDQLGNLWLDLTAGAGESASEQHVPLQTGDYSKKKWGRRTDNQGNKIYENTKLNEAAEANQAAIATSMGLKGGDKIANYNLFIGKYGPQFNARD